MRKKLAPGDAKRVFRHVTTCDRTKEKLETAYVTAINEGWSGVDGASWYQSYPLTVSRQIGKLGFCGKACQPT